MCLQIYRYCSSFPPFIFWLIAGPHGLCTLWQGAMSWKSGASASGNIPANINKSGQRRANVGPTIEQRSQRRRQYNVGPMSICRAAQRRPNVEPLLGQCWVNLRLMLGRRWPNLWAMLGQRFLPTIYQHFGRLLPTFGPPFTNPCLLIFSCNVLQIKLNFWCLVLQIKLNFWCLEDV